MASETQGEHTFDVEVLISGEEIRGYTAAEALSAGEPVYLSGDYEVSASSAGEGEFLGVNAVTAGDELLPDGLGTFETVATSTGSAGVILVQDGAALGEVAEGYIFTVQGATA